MYTTLYTHFLSHSITLLHFPSRSRSRYPILYFDVLLYPVHCWQYEKWMFRNSSMIQNSTYIQHTYIHINIFHSRHTDRHDRQMNYNVQKCSPTIYVVFIEVFEKLNVKPLPPTVMLNLYTQCGHDQQKFSTNMRKICPHNATTSIKFVIIFIAKICSHWIVWKSFHLSWIVAVSNICFYSTYKSQIGKLWFFYMYHVCGGG